MPDTTAPAMGAMQDILTLAAFERQEWEERLSALRASDVPLNADDGGAGGSGDGGDGGQGGSGEGGSGAGAGGDGGSGDGGDDALGEAGQKALAAERKRAAAAERRARELEAKVSQFESRDMTEQQKLEKRAAEAEGKVPTLEAENLRLRVALEKKVPAELIDRLKGNTKEEIAADADELLKLVGGGAGNGGSGGGFDGGARGTPPATDMDTLIRQRAGVV